jgi:phage FluMu protein gp41
MLKHCSIQELLEVRNGEGSLGARTHVDECAHCRDELDRIHQRVAALKALPSLNAPRDRWSVVRQGIVDQRRRIWFLRTGWAAAAAIALALGANGLLTWPAAAPNENELELQTLVEQSVELDNALVTVASRPRVVSGLAAVAIVDLEDQISIIDNQIGLIDVRVLRALSARDVAANQQRFDVRLLRSILEREVGEDQLRQLLQERVILLDFLINTHNKRTIYVGH